MLPFSGLPFADIDVDWSTIEPVATFHAPAGQTPASDLLYALSERLLARGELGDSLKARRASWWAVVREARGCVMGRLSREPSPVIATQPCDSAESFPLAFAQATIFPLWGLSSGFSTSLIQLLLTIAAVHLVFAALYYKWVSVLQRIPTASDDGPPGLRLHLLAMPLTYVSLRNESRICSS